MDFSRQEYWSGLPFPSPGDLPDPGMEPGPPALQADSLPSESPGKQSFINIILGSFSWSYVYWSLGLRFPFKQPRNITASAESCQREARQSQPRQARKFADKTLRGGGGEAKFECSALSTWHLTAVGNPQFRSPTRKWIQRPDSFWKLKMFRYKKWGEKSNQCWKGQGWWGEK